MAIIKQFDKRTGITYVYDSKSYYDKDKKCSRAKRTLIGKIDPDTGEMIPTDGRNKGAKSYWHCKKIMKDYNDGIIYVNCGYLVGPFNYNWNNVHHEISIQDFEAYPINFAWFMRELSSFSNSKAIFNDDNPYFVESLEKMIDSDNILETVSDEQLRLFKKYAAIEPSWRKKESIACDLYFPILLALSRI